MRFPTLSEWLAWQEQLHPRAIDLGLERLRRVLGVLGWQRPKCPVITVAGTNGKGSTVALLTRILSAAGYRVGTFTSPHLVRYNERITIAEREVSDASLMCAFERIDRARGENTLTFFEFNTLAALLIFETAAPDVIVLEVGMGGRLDAVNVVDPDVSIITSIALDHCDWLGADVEAIGAEKAGILRPQRPAIFGARDMPQSIARIASSTGTELHRLGETFDWDRDDGTWNWSHREFGRLNALPFPALLGEAQLDNASAVLTALASLRERLDVPRAAIEAGLRTVRLRGRFERIECGADWILDVAHNPAAANVLARSLAKLPPREPRIAVCAVLADKDLAHIYAELRDCFDEWIVAGLEGARALDPATLAQRLREQGARVTGECVDVRAACELASKRARDAGRVVVFGSFLTVGPALEWIDARCVTLA